MPSITDVVASLQAGGLPVLFLDTCSIIDVIRGPCRPDQLVGCVAAGAELLQLATAPPVGCTLVIGSFVPGEWLDHAQPAVDELTKHLNRLNNQAAYFHDACVALGIAPAFGRPTYGGVGLAAALHDLSKGLLDVSLRIDPHSDTNMRAFARAATKTPPSRKGGEIKDSTIIEECLEVARRLHATGFACKRVFCTSNVSDYCDASGSLYPVLAADFAAVGLAFVTNLPWAVHEMKT